MSRHVFIVPLPSAPRQALRGRLTLPQAPRGVIVFPQAHAGKREFGSNAAIDEAGKAGGFDGADAFDDVDGLDEFNEFDRLGAPDPATNALCARLHAAGFGTLFIALLEEGHRHEPRAPRADESLPLPLLTERLLAVVARLRRELAPPPLPPLPFGLVADDGMTPVAVRVAAQRDHDVRALVCQGGLIDLAGLQYLRLLNTPLLFLATADDERAIANLRQAQPAIGCVCQLRTLAAAGEDSDDEERIAGIVDWFDQHLVR